MYLIDTNICIYSLKDRYPSLSQKLLSIPINDIVISSITVGELYYGASKSRWGERTRHVLDLFLASYDILPFTDSDAKEWGKVRGELSLSGTPIGPYDAMIAAQGRARGLTVVTHNTKEFSRVHGLLLEDWVTED